MRREMIDEIVDGIHELHSFLSIEELIECMGIDLKVVPYDDPMLCGELASYFKFRETNKECIYLSESCPKDKEAFVLAHELGHAILHDVEMAHYKMLFKSRPLEKEADYFATKLLDLDVEKFSGYTVEDYANLYGVSPNAVHFLLNKENL